jgi:hypothetical protein
MRISPVVLPPSAVPVGCVPGGASLYARCRVDDAGRLLRAPHRVLQLLTPTPPTQLTATNLTLALNLD